MQLGMVGLGRMGSNLVRRVLRDGEHECVVYDQDATVVKALADEGATGASSVPDLAAKLTAPRAVWVMVPSGEITDSVIASSPGRWNRVTPSSTAETPSTAMISGARSSCRSAAFDCWTAAPAAACGVYSAATA